MDERVMTIREELLRAAKAGSHERLAAIVDSDPTLVDTADRNGWTLLCHAGFNGHTELVRLLIARGANVRLNQPIHYAGQRGHRQICRLLVEAGAVDHLADSQNPAALQAYRALYSFDAAQLSSILGQNPQVAQVRRLDGSTLLHEAAANGAVDVLRVLIKAGVQIDATNDHAQTALDRAILHNQIEAARFLIDSGAVCDAFTATRCGAGEKLAQLIDENSSVLNARDSDGRSLLETAMMLGQKQVVSLLLARGADDIGGRARQFCSGMVFENQRLSGTLFKNVNLAGSVFHDVNLSHAMFNSLNLANVTIEYANIDGLRIFGVEIAPLVEAELAKKRERHGKPPGELE